MKRTLATFALAAALGLSLTACGGGNGKFESIEDANQAVMEAGFPCGVQGVNGNDGSGSCANSPSLSFYETEAELEDSLRHYETVIIGELDMARPQLIRGKNWYIHAGSGNTEKLMAGLDGRLIGPDEPLMEME